MIFKKKFAIVTATQCGGWGIFQIFEKSRAYLIFFLFNCEYYKKNQKKQQKDHKYLLLVLYFHL